MFDFILDGDAVCWWPDSAGLDPLVHQRLFLGSKQREFQESNTFNAMDTPYSEDYLLFMNEVRIIKYHLLKYC
jgi:hypothetical protein